MSRKGRDILMFEGPIPAKANHAKGASREDMLLVVTVVTRSTGYLRRRASLLDLMLAALECLPRRWT
jgi:hypothetical protein